jgi:hypothetical protein
MSEIATPRVTPNGSEAVTGIYRQDAQPNAAPTPAVPQPLAKPGFQPGHIDADTAAAAQAVRSTPPVQSRGDPND